jgi:hypothetical protein
LQHSELMAQDQDFCSLPRPPRRNSRNHEIIRVIRRKANRRHMTGDHHGRDAGQATLLVRAVDGILGTHNTSASDASTYEYRLPAGLTERDGIRPLV